jgi:hypothetical protein
MRVMFYDGFENCIVRVRVLFVEMVSRFYCCIDMELLEGV